MANRRLTILLNLTPMWLMGLLICLSFWGLINTYQSNVVSEPDQTISRGVSYYLAESQDTPLNEILTLPEQIWKPQQQDTLSIPFAHQTYWLRVKLPALDVLDNWLLEIDHAQLDNLSVWFLRKENILAAYHTGDQMPFRSRGIAHERFLFPIPTQDDGPITVFFKLRNAQPMDLPMNLWRERSYLVFNGEHSMALGLFFGFMLAMAVSNFFFFVSTGSANFLLYTGYALSVALMLFSMHGMAYKYFWPDSIWMQNHSLGIFANASLLFALLFIRQLLDLSKYHILVDRSLIGLAGVFILFLLGSFFADSYTTIQFFLGVLTLTVVYLFGAGIWLWYSGLKVSRIYALAWITILITALFASLDGLKIYSSSIPTRYLLMTGALIETLLLALLLARNFSQQSRELLTTREHALDQEKEARAAKEEIIVVQQKANEDLEYNVQERTLELEITLRELEEKNQELEALNTHDALTSVRNRRYFDKKYAAELRLSRRNQTELAIAMIDIDHFKRVNDTYGHLAGDECLRHIAQVIKDNLKRPSDEVCRYGGEEFAILMPVTNEQGATQLVENIRQQIAKLPVVYASGEIPLTISAGVCCAINSADMPANLLLDTADKALYNAKQAGRNNVVYKALSAETGTISK